MPKVPVSMHDSSAYPIRYTQFELDGLLKHGRQHSLRPIARAKNVSADAEVFVDSGDESFGWHTWEGAPSSAGPGTVGDWIEEDGPHRVPYGKPESLLWVQESWAEVPFSAFGNSTANRRNPNEPYNAAIFQYGFDRCPPYWKSPSLMPRWASRLTLRVVAIRPVRLKELSRDVCLDQGIVERGPNLYAIRNVPALPRQLVDKTFLLPREALAALWDATYGRKHKCPYDSNPWVWHIIHELVPETTLNEAPTEAQHA